MSKNFHPFKDMKESAKKQHEVDKANFEAVKAESKANWEEAKLTPKQRQALMQKEREKQIEEANKKKAEAEERLHTLDEIKSNTSNE